MTCFRRLLVLSLLAALASCASPLSPAYQPYPAGPEEVGAAAGAERASASRERPGLGTSWGETHDSAVTHTAFERADPFGPTATGAFYYNDRQGAEAMAGQAGYRRLGAATFQLPGLDVSVTIRDASGEPLPAVSTASRCYAVGEAGARYTVQLQNHTDLRLEVVASVDGLDVIDGRTASHSKRGYLLRPGATLSIDGWRQSDEQVAAFRFGSVRGSYAARTGSDRNVGVIGVALFHERGATVRGPWTDEELRKRQSADPFPGRYATPPPPIVD